MAQLLDAPANPARSLAAAMRGTLGLTATPTLIPGVSAGVWTVLFGCQKDAAAAFAHLNPQCFGQLVRIVRLDYNRCAPKDESEDEGYVVRFSDFVDEMEADEGATAEQSIDVSSGHAASEFAARGVKRSSRSLSEPVSKRYRSGAAYQAGPVWRSEAKGIVSAAGTAAGG